MPINLDHALEATAARISEYSLFRNFTLDQVRQFCLHLEECCYKPGEHILHQGSTEATQLLILTHGSVRVERRLSEREIIPSFIANLGAGNIVGILGFIDGRAHTADVLAETEVHALALSRKTFKHLKSHHSDIAMLLLQHLVSATDDIACQMLERYGEAMHFMQGAYSRSPLPGQYT